jgi:hypothetical protein
MTRFGLRLALIINLRRLAWTFAIGRSLKRNASFLCPERSETKRRSSGIHASQARPSESAQNAAIDINHNDFCDFHPHPSNPRDNARDCIQRGKRAMDWKAANEQQQEVRWRIFLMFVVMAILIIRTGVVPRQLRGLLTFFPPAPALNPHSLSAENCKLPPRTRPSPSTDELQQAILVALLLAEAAGQMFILNGREVWKLMNQPLLSILPDRLVRRAGHSVAAM